MWEISCDGELNLMKTGGDNLIDGMHGSEQDEFAHLNNVLGMRFNRLLITRMKTR